MSFGWMQKYACESLNLICLFWAIPFLHLQVICIFAVSGACNSYELPRIKLKDVENHGDMLLVRIAKYKTKPERSFTITGTIRNIVQKYIDLRAPYLEEERFFLNFQRGKCTRQVIGKNKMGMMPRRIAKFLQLPNPDSFTGTYILHLLMYSKCPINNCLHSNIF